jgi:hypothetical protein
MNTTDSKNNDDRTDLETDNGMNRNMIGNSIRTEMILNEEKIFARRDSIPRSPPGTPIVEQVAVEYTPDNKIQKTKKRKTVSSPITLTQNETPKELHIFLNKLVEKTEQFFNFANDKTNLHREAKDMASELKCLAAQAFNQGRYEADEIANLQIQIDNMKREQAEEIQKLERKTKDLQKTINELSNSQRATREELSNKCSVCHGNEVSRPLFDIREHNITCFEDVSTYLNEKWSKSCYENIAVENEDALRPHSGRLIHFLTNDEKTNLDERILERYPEIQESEKQSCDAGKYINITNTTSYISEHGQVTKRSNFTVFLADTLVKEEKKMAWIFKCLKKAKELTENEEDENIVIISPNDVDIEIMKKMTSAVLHKYKSRVIIRRKLRERKISQNYNKETILVDSDSNTYASVLRDIKGGLKTEEVNTINSVRKTRKGQILMRVNKDSQTLKNRISEVLAGKEVKSLSRRKKIIHADNIEASVSLEELKEAIMQTCLPRYPELLEVRPLRPSRYDRQTATVLLEAQDATRLASLKKIRVGFGVCQLRERIELIKCFRCWGYGHKAAACSEVDRSKQCRKCSKEDHTSEKCQNEEYCPLCNKSGHTAGTSRCTVFKNALSEMRKKKSTTTDRPIKEHKTNGAQNTANKSGQNESSPRFVRC